MGPKQRPQGLEELLRDSLVDSSAQPREVAAPGEAKVQRRGNDAVLDSDDCEIIVYELFGDRA